MFFKILLETRMRKDEAASLKWYDINFKEKRIIIDDRLNFQAENEELFWKHKNIQIGVQN
ncbi:tyrosine-type recombinase/integrase [Paenibacillus sp. FSL H7-0940]|uniref:tyrosine-type recombinase/integrase n=1 Tax=Paenibacillus sp. FSL H7-0940 TaxID=2921443 RepID=UPI0030ECDA5C